LTGVPAGHALRLKRATSARRSGARPPIRAICPTGGLATSKPFRVGERRLAGFQPSAARDAVPLAIPGPGDGRTSITSGSRPSRRGRSAGVRRCRHGQRAP
jgi:hypothetical protein